MLKLEISFWYRMSFFIKSCYWKQQISFVTKYPLHFADKVSFQYQVQTFLETSSNS